jgi:tetratricopeptide (TPR) repeat protein
MKRRILLLLLFGLLTASSVFAVSMEKVQQAFVAGNTAYEKGDFESAENNYRRAIDEGVANHKLYYNYANALFRDNKLGLAILYWEKAAKLNPSDPDIQQNLRFSRARITDKISEPPTNWITRALWILHSGYSINQGLWTALVTFSFFSAALFLVLASTGWLRGLGITAASLTLTCLLVLLPSLAYKIQQQENAVGAIVLKPVLEVYSGPGDSYQLLARVHEGTKFTIEQISGEWVSVKLANGTGGWARYAELGKI